MKDHEKPISNYELFRQDALKRFLTFDQERMIGRLNLHADEAYIYVDYFGQVFRFGRKEASLEVQKDGLAGVGRADGKETAAASETAWKEAGPNETLALCDLLCHTGKPIVVSDRFTTLQSLNRVQGGNTDSTLGGGMFHSMELFLDGKIAALDRICQELGGTPAGKGDVAYEIPVFEPIHLQFSFYGSDEEFDAKITVLFPEDICGYLHYETLYYVVMTLLDLIRERAEKTAGQTCPGTEADRV